jgi:hypothetical protein
MLFSSQGRLLCLSNRAFADAPVSFTANSNISTAK